jgi:hypothetical protein
MIFVLTYINALFYRYDSCHNWFMTKKQITYEKIIIYPMRVNYCADSRIM